jgi:hypothetical protein
MARSMLSSKVWWKAGSDSAAATRYVLLETKEGEGKGKEMRKERSEVEELV